MKTKNYHSLNEKVYGYFLHQYSAKEKIPTGQIKYHKKNFQKYFVLKENQFKGKEILDTGAGPGVHSVILSMLKANVTAVDLSKENMKKLNFFKKIYKLKKLKYIRHDLSNKIKGNKKYDLISVHNWIQHTPNPYLILKNLSQKIDKGGKIYISCYQSNTFRTTIGNIARSLLLPSDFDLMLKLGLSLFPLGFKKYKNMDHAQFGLMFDDFFTPYFHTVTYKDLISDFNSLGLKPITKVPKIKNIYLEHMPYVRMGFIKTNKEIRPSYKPFYIDRPVKFKKNSNKIINETHKLINKLKKIKKTNRVEIILFCMSLFDLSCQFSNDRSFEKYKVLNSFLDRFISKNYTYLSAIISVKKNKNLYK